MTNNTFYLTARFFSEDKRNRAAAIFRILGLIQFVLGLLLLILGGVGQAFHGKTDNDGAHYYSGGFLVGGFVSDTY